MTFGFYITIWQALPVKVNYKQMASLKILLFIEKKKLRYFSLEKVKLEKMSQRNIKSYFIKDTSEKEVSESSSSDSDEDLHVSNYILASGDVSYYNDLLKSKSELKKVAKVVCDFQNAGPFLVT